MNPNFKWKTPMTEIFGALNYGNAGTDVAIQQTGLTPGNYKVQLLLYEYGTLDPGRTLNIGLEGEFPTSYTLPTRPTGTVWSQVVNVAADGLEPTGTLNVAVSCTDTYGPVSGMLVSTTAELPGAATWAVVDDPADLDYANLVSATTFGNTQGTRRVGDVTFYGCYPGNTTAEGVSCASSAMLSSYQTGAVVKIPIEDLYGSSVWDQTDGTLNVSVAADPGSYALDLLFHDNYAYEHLTSYERNVDITVEGTVVATDFNYFENQGMLQQGVMMTVPVTLSAGGDGTIDIVIDGTPYGYTSTTCPAISGLVLRSVNTVRIPGDATGDGKVHEEDAVVLASHWGTASGMAWTDGDFTEDGAVNAADAAILTANWGYGVSEASAGAVPEPATASLLLAAVLLGLAAPRRRA